MATDVHDETTRTLIDDAFLSGKGTTVGDPDWEPYTAGIVFILSARTGVSGGWYGVESFPDNRREYYAFGILAHVAFDWLDAQPLHG
jgi:hypothetical protein